MSQADEIHTTIATKSAAASAVSTLARRKAKQASAPKFVDPATIETRFYGLIVRGACLEPKFKHGDTVVIDKEGPLHVGCYAGTCATPARYG